MNVQETANILMAVAVEYKGVKRNKSGSVNENSRYAIWKRARVALIEAGNPDASEMLREVEKGIL